MLLIHDFRISYLIGIVCSVLVWCGHKTNIVCIDRSMREKICYKSTKQTSQRAKAYLLRPKAANPISQNNNQKQRSDSSLGLLLCETEQSLVAAVAIVATIA